jgi:WD40 repeat protein
LFSLAISSNEKYLVGSSGFGQIYIWDLKTGKLLHYMVRNDAQTFATISPDGQYVVSGDDDGNIFQFSLQTGKLIKAIQRYEYFVHSIKFISNNDFFVFLHGNYPFATLYSLNTGKKLKRLSLLSQKQKENVKTQDAYYNDGEYPATYTYLRDQATDTSPSAHVLVMAMSEKNGILVYHYAPKTQTLKQVWAPVIAPTHWWHFW